MGTGVSIGLLSKFDDLSLFYGTAVVLCFWLVLLFPAHVLSKRFSASYRESDRPTRAEWLSRCNSNVHAVGVTLGFLYCIFFEPKDGLYGGGPFVNRRLFRRFYLFGLGYFVSDALIVTSFVQTISSPFSTLAHHFVSSAAILYVYGKDAPLAYVWGGVLFLTEASTPFINMRFFLAIRHRNENRYKLTGALMTLAFLAARPIGIPLLILWMMQRDVLFTSLEPGDLRTFTIVGSAVTGGLYALNVYWSKLMLTGLKKALRKSREKETDVSKTE